MRGMSRLSIWGLVALMGLVLSPVLLAAGGQGEMMEEMSFEVAAGGALEVEVSDADIRIEPGAERVQVEVWLRSDDMDWAREHYAKLRFSGTQDGRTVLLKTDPERGSRSAHRHRFGLEVRVRVPESFDLDLHTGDGDVVVGGLQGNVTIKTGDGDLSLGNLGGGTVRLQTGDGDIQADRLEGDDIKVHTGDGDIRIAAAAGALKISTGDGDVRVMAVEGDGSSISTGDGSIHVGLQQAVALELLTGDGDIQVSSPAALGVDIDLHGEDVHLGPEISLRGTLSDGRAQGQLNGGGPLIRARTGDGTIRLNLGHE